MIFKVLYKMVYLNESKDVRSDDEEEEEAYAVTEDMLERWALYFPDWTFGLTLLYSSKNVSRAAQEDEGLVMDDQQKWLWKRDDPNPVAKKKN